MKKGKMFLIAGAIFIGIVVLKIFVTGYKPGGLIDKTLGGLFPGRRKTV